MNLHELYKKRNKLLEKFIISSSMLSHKNYIILEVKLDNEKSSDFAN